MNRLNTDTATIVGLWVGIGGFATGVAGIGLTLYSFYKAEPDTLLLTASGWAAAVLTALSMGALGKWLVATIVELGNDLKEQNLRHEKDIGDLNFRLAEALAEKKSVIAISEFLAVKAVRTTTRRKQAAPDDAGEQNTSTTKDSE